MAHEHIQPMTPIFMFINFLFSICLIIHAKIILLYNQVLHIPPIFIELLQCLSYAGSFLIAILTIYKFLKERRKNGNNK